MKMSILEYDEESERYIQNFDEAMDLNRFRIKEENEVWVFQKPETDLNKRLIQFKLMEQSTRIYLVSNATTFDVLVRLREGKPTNLIEPELMFESDSNHLDSDEQSVDAPSQLQFLDKMIEKAHAPPDWTRRIEPLETPHQIKPGSFGVLIGHDSQSDKIEIIFNDKMTSLSSDEYDQFSEWIVDYLERLLGDEFVQKVEDWIKDPSTIEALPEYIRKKYNKFDQNLHRENLRFKEKYCRTELNFAQFNLLIPHINSEDELRRTMDELTEKYRNGHPSLGGSSAKLNEWYQSIPAITMNRHPPWEWTGVVNPDNSVSVDRNISIAYWMLRGHTYLRSANLETSGRTAGGTLYVNSREQSWYARSAWNRNVEAYDFAENIAELIYNKLIKSLRTTSNFVVIDDALVSNLGDFSGILLHKHHALHVYSFLIARGVEQDA